MAKELVIRNDIIEVGKLQPFLEEFQFEHQIPFQAINDINLAVEELIVNDIEYGFPDGGEHEIRILLEREGDDVVVEIRERGEPFNPFTDAPEVDLQTPLQQMRIGGLGVHMVKEVMHGLSYTTENGVNRLVMRRKAE